jgi:hypothetical protein
MTNYIPLGKCSQASSLQLAAHAYQNLKDMEWMLPLPRLSKEEKREQFQKTVEKLRCEYES